MPAKSKFCRCLRPENAARFELIRPSGSVHPAFRIWITSEVWEQMTVPIRESNVYYCEKRATTKPIGAMVMVARATNRKSPADCSCCNPRSQDE